MDTCIVSRLGLSSWLWEEHDLLEGISIVAEYGIRNIEVSPRTFGFSYESESWMSQLRNTLDKHEVRIAQTHPGEDRKFDLSLGTAVDGDKPIGHLKTWARAFAQFNNPILVLHASEVFPSTEDRSPRLNTFKDNLAQLAEFCSKHDTKVAVETMWNITGEGRGSSILGETEDEFRDIIDTCNADNVGIHIDTGHSFLSGNLLEMVKWAGSRLFSLHMHDNHGKQEQFPWDEHLIPGQGNIDWGRFLEALDDVDYRGVLMLEVGSKGTLAERLTDILTSTTRVLQQTPS